MKRTKNKHVMDFLLSRRSDSARTLIKPTPTPASLKKILTAAARTPDHGKLNPWRFLILSEKILPKIAEKILKFGEVAKIDPNKALKTANIFLKSPLIVAVICSPKSTLRIPLIEQKLSAGAVCLSLLNAAQAEGWGANWLTGWISHDKQFSRRVLGLSKSEFVAGFIHIGTKTIRPVERERPDLTRIISWLDI